MIQLNVLSGKMAGRLWVARHFPVRIGRAGDCDLRLEEEGVWDHHAELSLDPQEGFLLGTHADARALVNGQPVQAARLRNGDSIHIGSVRMQFSMGTTHQRGVRLQEWFVWGLVTAVSLAEVAVAYYLL